MLYSLLFAGGKGAAKNPSLSFGGSGEHSALSNLDPLGNFITGFGGDPLNLYGNKNNPNALLFPSAPNAGAGGKPSPLFQIGRSGGNMPFPNLPALSGAPQQPMAGGLNFQGMPGYGAASGGGQPPQSFNPFLAALMAYTNPPPPPQAPAGPGGGRGGMMDPGVMRQLAQMRGGGGMPMRRMQ